MTTVRYPDRGRCMEDILGVVTFEMVKVVRNCSIECPRANKFISFFFSTCSVIILLHFSLLPNGVPDQRIPSPCNWVYTTRLSYQKRHLGRNTPQKNVPGCITEFLGHFTVQGWNFLQQTYGDNQEGLCHDILSEDAHIRDNELLSLSDTKILPCEILAIMENCTLWASTLGRWRLSYDI